MTLLNAYADWVLAIASMVSFATRGYTGYMA